MAVIRDDEPGQPEGPTNEPVAECPHVRERKAVGGVHRSRFRVARRLRAPFPPGPAERAREMGMTGSPAR